MMAAKKMVSGTALTAIIGEGEMTTNDQQGPAREGEVARKTNETDVKVAVTLDGGAQISVQTGLAFLDHLITSFATHARINLHLTAVGDIEVDDHHTVEDVGIALGEAIRLAVGDRISIHRFGTGYAPLDEALARVVIDLSNRPGAWVQLALRRERIGDVSTENLTHFFSSFATAARVTLHVDVIRGENDHHKVEAAFKALALACREAWQRDLTIGVPSTKGVL
jgi:imidazoleglycerol-phosphate dehydratase